MNRRARQFDPDTGQVFHEQQLSATLLGRHVSRDACNWHRVTPQTSHVSGLRINPLKTMCLNVLRNNVGLLEEDTLQNVPDQLLCELWAYLKDTQEPQGIMSFQAWKVFVRSLSGRREIDIHGQPSTQRHAFRENECFTLRNYFRQISDLAGPLEQYVGPLISPAPFGFITHLTIAPGASFATSEFFVLTKMKNLGVLEFVQPQNENLAAIFPRITDSVVREWSQAVDPFPCLRILRIWGEDFTTYRSIDYVTRLPALGIYDVAGRREDWKSDVAHHSAWQRIYSRSHSIQENAPRFDEHGKLVNSGHRSEWVPSLQGNWAEESYAYLGLLWKDRDLEDQNREIHVRGTLLREKTSRPSLPYASIGLGNTHSCYDLGENRRMTFLRSNPWLSDPAPTPRKRAGDEDKRSRRTKATKLRGVNDLLSQFATG
ncbi:hypothetical protein BKA67DRAFT_535130 [Truncatella angustata]|uniref:Uncharacterized protein n=1 Tax=Truncatella angustata TaxID=152316 RepID=A0A9P8UKC5_9PEZI|nr:uncharacterized protein BKA67DRAFT_535130 [Truncatella angustata]KAH6653773.1 hypothetical protein BKA67DRAFT_535130 [Truncatella angustata]